MKLRASTGHTGRNPATPTAPADWARAGRVVAETIEMANPATARLLRELAAAVDDLTSRLEHSSTFGNIPTADDCPVCGEPVVQPSRGRRRIYCTEEHRRQADATRRLSRNARKARLVP